VIVAGKGAKQRIGEETTLSLVPVRQMENRDGLYSDDCTHFLQAEKDKILVYSRRAYPAKPKGHGDCGYLLVFQHRCPNNSIPILHRSNRRWDALFPRHDVQV